MLGKYENAQNEFACLSSNRTCQINQLIGLSMKKALEVRGSTRSVLYIKALNSAN